MAAWGRDMVSFFRLLVVPVLFLASCVAQIAEPQRIVGKIHGFHLAPWEVRTESGTGWCLDQRCTTLVTAYHVAKPIGSHISFNGVKIRQAHFATGPNDEGARVLPSRLSSALTLTFAWVRDLSLLRLETPSPQMHGIPLFPGQLQPDEQANIYGYPGGHFASVPAKFVREVEKGILEFDLRRLDGVTVLEGLSGGLVVNRLGEAVGLLFALAQDGQHAYAVPMWSLADFVKNARPDLYPELFPREIYRPAATPMAATTELADDLELGPAETDPFDPLTIVDARALDSTPVMNENAMRDLEKPRREATLQEDSFEVRNLRGKEHRGLILTSTASTENLPPPPAAKETRMADSVISAFCQDAVVVSACGAEVLPRPAFGRQPDVSRPLAADRIASTYYLDLAPMR
jgi:hypothetical protein